MISLLLALLTHVTVVNVDIPIGADDYGSFQSLSIPGIGNGTVHRVGIYMEAGSDAGMSFTSLSASPVECHYGYCQCDPESGDVTGGLQLFRDNNIDVMASRYVPLGSCAFTVQPFDTNSCGLYSNDTHYQLCGYMTGENASYFAHDVVNMKYVRISGNIEHAAHHSGNGMEVEYARSWGRIKFVIVWND